MSCIGACALEEIAIPSSFCWCSLVVEDLHYLIQSSILVGPGGGNLREVDFTTMFSSWAGMLLMLWGSVELLWGTVRPAHRLDLRSVVW